MERSSSHKRQKTGTRTRRELKNPTDHDTPGLDSHNRDPSGGIWQCRRCTFHNDRMEAPVCEVCGGEREGDDDGKCQRTGPTRELKNLADGNTPGIDGHAWDPSAVSLHILTAPSRAESRGGGGGRNRFHIIERCWDRAGNGVIVGDDGQRKSNPLPIHFRRDLAAYPISEEVLSIRGEIMTELSQRANRDDVHSTSTSTSAAATKYERHIKVLPSGGCDGYYRAHLHESTIRTLLAGTGAHDGGNEPQASSDHPVPALPPPFVVHEKADQKGMAFINTKFLKSCDTHSDRDNSILWVIGGRKRVMLARPPNHLGIVQSNSTIFEEWKPFDDGASAGGLEWKSVDLETGDALFLPKHVIHAVQSDGGTFALSFQVQRSSR